MPYLAGVTEAILQSELDADMIKRFMAAMATETFTKDAYIIRQGTSGDRFYMLEDGEVRPVLGCGCGWVGGGCCCCYLVAVAV